MDQSDKNYRSGYYEDTDQELPDDSQDPLLAIYSKVAQKPQYGGEEQGLYHPLFHQTIKMRNNEMIDFYTDKNNGIRLDPKTQSINFMSNHMKYHVAAITSWVTGHVSEYTGGNHIEKVRGRWRQDVDGNIEMRGNSKLYVTIIGNADIKVGGNLSATVEQNATIESKGDMKLRSDKNIDMYAGRDVRIDAGNKIYWG